MQPQQTLLRKRQLVSSMMQTLGRPARFHQCMPRPAKRAIGRPCIRTGMLNRESQLHSPMAWHCTTSL